MNAERPTGWFSSAFRKSPHRETAPQTIQNPPTRDVEGVASIQAEEPVPGKHTYRCNSGILHVPLEDTGFGHGPAPLKH